MRKGNRFGPVSEETSRAPKSMSSTSNSASQVGDVGWRRVAGSAESVRPLHVEGIDLAIAHVTHDER